MALKFHQQIISDLLEDSNGGLVILSSGLSLAKLIASILILHSPSQGTLLLLLSPASQSLKSRIFHQISSLDSPLPMEITVDLPANQYYLLYSSGSSFFITPWILIVDLLTQRITVSSLSGIFLRRLLPHRNLLHFLLQTRICLLSLVPLLCICYPQLPRYCRLLLTTGSATNPTTGLATTIRESEDSHTHNITISN